MNDLAGESVINLFDDVNKLFWHPIVEKDVPNAFSIYAIESLFKVYKANIQGRLPFNRLFYNNS